MDCVEADEGNRTLVCSLGSCRSTIELHPQVFYESKIIIPKRHRGVKGRGDMEGEWIEKSVSI